MSKLILTQESTTPSPPSSGQDSIYTKTDNVVYTLSSTGIETALGSSNSVTSLTGDVTGSGPGVAATTVQYVGGQTAANVAAATVEVEAATSANTSSTLVKRDSSGNFSAGTVTASLIGNVTGNASTATSAVTAIDFTGTLNGDVTGTQSATVVSTVGGQTASAVASAVVEVQDATPSNTAGTLVQRDASGNFSANVITASLTGNVTGNVSGSSSSFTGSLSGDVTGTQSATSIASTTVTGKLLTGYAAGTNTPITSTDTVLVAFENLQAQISAASGSAITALAGDVDATGPGSATATIQPNVVDNTKLAQAPSLTIKGNNTGATANESDLTVSQTTSMLNNNTSPVQIGTSNIVGSSQYLALADHVHAITSPIVLGLVLTGYTTGTNTPIAATNTLLQAFENLQAQVSAGASSAITSLTGDVAASGPGAAASTVNSVGGQTAAAVATAATSVAAATSADTPSTLVERDSSGNFSANVITASLTGNVTGNVSGSSSSFTGSLSGDVTGTQSATVVGKIQGKTVSNVAPTDAQFLVYNNSDSQYNPEQMSGDISMTNAGVTTVGTVGGSTASSIHSAATSVAAATSADTPSTLVERDSSGNFSANVITASLTGNVTGNVSGSSSSFTGSLLGDVTGTQSVTLLSKIQGTAITGTTGSGNVALSASPTFTGTISAAAISASGQISSTDSSTTAVTLNSTSFIFDTVDSALGIGVQPQATSMITTQNTTGTAKPIWNFGYGVGSSTGLRGDFARGTVGTPAATQAGDTLNFISGRGYGASQFAASSTGSINVYAGETFTNTSNMTYVTVQATPTGSVTKGEHLRVSGTGVTLGPQSSSTDVHQINGGVNRTTRTVTANYTVDTTTTDDVILCNQTAAISIQLPNPVVGRTIVIKDRSGNAQTYPITLLQYASETIEGLNASKVLYTNYGSWTLHVGSAGNWWMV
jgi:trimeric autotransporter adhesin